MVRWEVVRMTETTDESSRDETLAKVAKALEQVEGSGAIHHHILCWIDSKKMNGTPREELSEMVISSAKPEDIHEAKEALKDHVRLQKSEFTQEKAVSVALTPRQGNKKVQSEVKDILDLMEFLDERKSMPILMMSSRQLAKIPKKAREITKEDICDKLDIFQQMVKALENKVDANHGEVKRDILGIKPSYVNITKEIGATLQQGQEHPPAAQGQQQQRLQQPQQQQHQQQLQQGGPGNQGGGRLQPPTFSGPRQRSRSTKRSRMDNDDENDMEVEEVFIAPKQQRGFRGNGGNNGRGRKRFDSRRTAVEGTDNSGKFAAPVDIFVANVCKDTTEDMIKDFLKEKELVPISIQKISHKDARNDSFKVSVNRADQERAILPSNWPLGVRVRIYRHFRWRPEAEKEKGAGVFQS